jgi:tripartite-type tricarboxylate transporter receptor subunit TctC
MKRINAFALAGLVTAFAPAAHAQDFPNRPIRMVVGYGAGGTTDILARVIAEKLGTQLGQTVVVENRTGAAGGIAAAAVARAPADGYTLFMGTVASHGINPALYKKLDYDPVGDFSPVSMVAAIPLVLVVNNKLPVSSVQDLIKLAKNKPGSLNYSSGGNGSPVHLAGELFARAAGVELTHVPYRSGAQGNASVIAGETQLSFALMPAVLPQIAGGQLKPLAITVQQRSAVLPDLVPLAQTPGFEKYSVNSWNAIFAPKGTPPQIVARLQRSVEESLKNPELRAKFLAAGADPVSSTPAELATFVGEELALWKKAVTDAKLELE